MLFRSFVRVAALLSVVDAAPTERPSAPKGSAQALADPNYGPIPGQDPLYNDERGRAAPFPANFTAAILPTTHGPPGVDDQMWQNLLAAEWVIYAFYQNAVELFNKTSFEEAGYHNYTYDRIQEIRDNEAGHLRIFQNEISSNSVKPGACQYDFGLKDPTTFLAIATLLEISAMAFLTGLTQQAQLPFSRGALLAIGETESRHNTWLLIDVWKADPFGGPSDTIFPYANQILSTTSAFVVPGSCPPENPGFPTPDQHLPTFGVDKRDTSLTPGSHVYLDFSAPHHNLHFDAECEYYAVFFHGVTNITVPFNTKDNSTTIPAEFEEKGVIIAVIADKPGAPTQESVIAGPGIILEQPSFLAIALASA